MPGSASASADVAAFHALLQNAIETGKAQQQSGGLLLIEINNFASILQINGRPFIEEMFVKITVALQAALSDAFAICRVQVKQLAVITKEVSAQQLSGYADVIHKRIRAVSCELSGAPICIVPFIGGVHFLSDIAEAGEAMDKAYIALDHCQYQYSTHYASYDDACKDLQMTKNQMLLAYCMEDALLHKKLRLAFQPIINSKTGVIVHHECLLRIISDEGKVMSVGPFIPVVEEMGFIDEIDELVLEMVCEELRASPMISLAFNISAIGISNPAWLKKAKQLFKDPELASRAIIEITETAAQQDIIQSAKFVTALQDMGCQVALDDFGAGHTSFQQLKDLPVDIIKIDGSFIRDIAENDNNRLFVKALLDISKNFGIKAVAEFVETGEIAKMLIELKVDYMQGNYFSPAVNYRSWVQEEAL